MQDEGEVVGSSLGVIIISSKANGGESIMDLFRSTACVVLFVLFSSSVFSQSQFARTAGGSSADRPLCVIETADGGYMIAGGTNSFGAGGQDVLLAKFGAYGNLEWTRTVGGPLEDWARSLAQSSDGGYVVGGYTQSYGAGQRDFFIAKFDSSSALEWAKTLGGPEDDRAYSVIHTADGGYAMGGWTRSFSGGPGSEDMLIAKFDASGSHEWTRTLGTPLAGELGYALIQKGDGGYVMTAWADVEEGHMDDLVAELDATGDLESARILGIRNTGYILPLIQTSDGGYAVTGGYRGSIVLAKLDSVWNYQWTRGIGGDEGGIIYALIESEDGGYAVAGATSKFGSWGVDLFLAKFDRSGNCEWARVWGGENDDDARALIQTADRGYFVAGTTRSFAPGSMDALVTKIDYVGNSCVGDFVTPSVDTLSFSTESMDLDIYEATPTITDITPQVSSPVPSQGTVCVEYPVCGDCNGDRNITVADAVYLVSYIYGAGPVPMDFADVNLDRRITIADATYIHAHLARGGPAPCNP